MLESGSLLDDNQWHFVRYSRKEKTVSLTVDDVMVSAKTNGYFKQLNLDDEVCLCFVKSESWSKNAERPASRHLLQKSLTSANCH